MMRIDILQNLINLSKSPSAFSMWLNEVDKVGIDVSEEILNQQNFIGK